VSVAPRTLLLPAALVDAQWLGSTRLTALAASQGWASLARRTSVADEVGAPDGPPPDPGHERWLHRHLELPAGSPLAAWAVCAEASPGASRPGGHATATAGAAGSDIASPRRWRLDPVHLHVGRDHLVLTDPAALALSAPDAAALAAAVAPLFENEGLVLRVDAPSPWALHEADASRPLRLSTRSLLGALGRSIDAWLPGGEDARRWRRLVNEVQMTWFDHPVNARREASGLLPVNSLWIEGPCHIAGSRGGGDERAVRRCAAAARLAARAPGAGSVEIDDGTGMLVLDDRLLAAQVAGDPQRWADAWQALDAERFVPIARAQAPWAAGVRLVLAGDAGWRELDVAPRADWRFWRRGDPAALLAEPRGAPVDVAASAR
jgi:hypothetical protein